MEINTAGALSLYTYQSALQNAQSAGATPAGAQGAAVYQALTSAYASITNSSSGDPLVDAAGASGLASLVSGIYSAAAAAGGGTGTPIASLSSSLATAVGGTDASSASGLLSGLGTDGLDGISADALSLNTTLAMAAYTDAQNGLPSGTLTSLAQTAAANIDATQPSSVQAAIQASLTGSFTNTLNLLA